MRVSAATDAPKRARVLVRNSCFDLPTAVVDDAELLTSEIVSNVVQHAGGDLTVDIECDEQSIQVAVADESRQPPIVREHVATDSTCGRGMTIVSRLAADWGCRPRSDGPGKVVWFRLPVGAAR